MLILYLNRQLLVFLLYAGGDLPKLHLLDSPAREQDEDIWPPLAAAEMPGGGGSSTGDPTASPSSLDVSKPSLPLLLLRPTPPLRRHPSLGLISLTSPAVLSLSSPFAC